MCLLITIQDTNISSYKDIYVCSVILWSNHDDVSKLLSFLAFFVIAVADVEVEEEVVVAIVLVVAEVIVVVVVLVVVVMLSLVLFWICLVALWL